MALTKVSGGILDPGIDVAGIVTATGFDGPFVGGSSKNITAGTVTATELDINGNGDISGNLVVGGNLTANGDFTTLNTTLREVELLRVDAQNDNVAAGIITQRGSGDILKLYDTSTPVFVVKDGGKVGIGTDNPGAELDIEGASARIHLHDRDGNQAQIIQGGNALFLNLDSEGNGNGSLRIRSGGNTGDSEIIRIKEDGTVGIGSTIPTEKLDVIGNIKSSGNVLLSGDLDVTGVSTFAGITTVTGNTLFTKQLNVSGISTFNGINNISGEVNIGDSASGQTTNRLRIGDDADIQIYHDSSTTNNHFIAQNGLFYLQNDNLRITAANTAKAFIRADVDSHVKLYYASNEKFATSGIGATVFGQLDTTTLKVGTGVTALTNGNVSIGGTLELFNTTGDALNNPSEIKISNLIISQHQNTGTYKVQNSNATGSLLLSAGGSGYGGIYFWNGNFTRQYFTAQDQGSISLYYNNTVRFETSGIGVTVTGEIATSQDYPNFRPTLDFNFAAERKLDPRITYSRTGSASFVNEFGKVVLVGDNVPRFDYGHEYVNANSYKLTNSESRGLLIEEERTNLVAYSIYDGDKSGTAQTSSGDIGNWDLTLGHATFTGGIDAPDGSNDAVRFTALNTGNAIFRIPIPAFTPNGSDTYTLSFYARAISGTGNITFDLADGDPMLGSWSNNMITNEWVRIQHSAVPSNASKTFIDIMSNADNNRVFDIWGVQLEKGAFATSFIPTHGSTVTRAADSVKVDGEEFSEFYHDTENTTIMVGKRLGNTVTDGRLYSISDGTNNNRIDWDFNDDTKLRFSASSGGTTVTNQEILSWDDDKEFKIAAGMALNNQIGVLNGTAIAAADTSCAMPIGVDRLFFGLRGNGGNQGSLTIKRFMFYKKRLPDSQLVTLTS